MTWLHAFAVIALVEAILLASALVVVSAQRDAAKRRVEDLRLQNRELLNSFPLNGYNLDVANGRASQGDHRVDISW